MPDKGLEAGLLHRVRVLEELHLAEVVGGCENDAVGAAVDRVDICPVGEGRPDALDWPTEGAGPGGPGLVAEG